MTPTPPPAQVIGHQGRTVFIRCPYCQGIHSHALLAPGKQRFAPKCGLTRTPNQRATGYEFETTPPQHRGTNKGEER